MPKFRGDREQERSEAKCKGGVGSTRWRGEEHALVLPLYPPCWKCKRPIGCRNCAGPIDDVLCTACAVWTTVPSFVEHGPIVNTDEMVRKRHGLVAPEFDEYPLEFINAYLEKHGRGPKRIDRKTTFKQLIDSVHLR